MMGRRGSGAWPTDRTRATRRVGREQSVLLLRNSAIFAKPKKLGDAWQPLYQTVNPDQKRRMAVLTIYVLREMRSAAEQRRLQTEADDAEQ